MTFGGVSIVRLRLLAILGLLLAALLVAGCGSDDESASSSSSEAEPAKKIKIGLVTDIGGLNDRSFNSLAYDGLKRAE